MNTDEDLMIAYIDGSTEAFGKLYRRYRGRINAYIFKRAPSELRDDIFQKVFLKLHEKKHLYKRDHAFAPWFYTLCRNVIIDELRKRKYTFVELTDIASEQESSDNTDLPYMTEENYKLLYMKFVEEYDYKELESEFNRSAQTLRKRVSRVIKLLRSGA